jgi:hypothetical protein
MGGTMNNMKTSKHWTILLCLFPIIGTFGQTVTTYHSAFGIPAVESSYLAVDIAVTDPIANPNYRASYRLHQAPALIDTRTRIGITITGTVAQAEAQLNAAISNQYPASVRFKNKDRKAEAAGAASKAAAANSVPALRAEVARLAELVESLLEDEELP